MKLREFSVTPFTQLINFTDNNLLVVHRALMDRSEFFNISSISRIEQSGDFFSFTYKQVSDLTKIIADKMVSNGFANPKFIPVLTSNPFDLILSVISLWRIGSIPVPLNIHLLKNDLKDQISFLKAENIICETNFAHDFPSLDVFSDSSNSLPDVILPNDFDAQDTAVLLFTSGTSGTPKAVPLSFNNLSAAFIAGNSVFNYSKDDSWYLNLPLYHIGGFSILVRAILAGSSIILPESNELASLKSNLEIVKPTLVSLVPTQLKRICESGIHPNKELRAALIGGGFSDDDLLTNASNIGWKIYKVYGSTETSAFITVLSPDNLFRKSKSVGIPLNNVEIKIFSERKRILEVNEIGEIGVKALSVFNGYLYNYTDESSAFYNEYYLTGDYGFFDKDGFLHLENRRTDLIVSGGENISPFEIENVILQFQNIDEVFVFGLPDAEWGEIIAAALISKDKRKINFPGLKIFLKEKLPSFKIPKKYFQVEGFPKSAVGKIKRSEAKKLFN